LTWLLGHLPLSRPIPCLLPPFSPAGPSVLFFFFFFGFFFFFPDGPPRLFLIHECTFFPPFIQGFFLTPPFKGKFGNPSFLFFQRKTLPVPPFLPPRKSPDQPASVSPFPLSLSLDGCFPKKNRDPLNLFFFSFSFPILKKQFFPPLFSQLKVFVKGAFFPPSPCYEPPPLSSLTLQHRTGILFFPFPSEDSFPPLFFPPKCQKLQAIATKGGASLSEQKVVPPFSPQYQDPSSQHSTLFFVLKLQQHFLLFSLRISRPSPNTFSLPPLLREIRIFPPGAANKDNKK